MKRKAAAILILTALAALALSSCTSANNNQQKKIPASSKVSMAANVQVKFTTQNITSVANFKTPDEIVYYHNGKQDSFTKYNSKFQTIISLNAKRGGGKLEMLESVMTIDLTDKNLNMLEYKYFSGYATIYFPLNATAEGKYIVAQPVTSTSRGAQNYGFLSSPDKLIDYINSSEKE